MRRAACLSVLVAATLFAPARAVERKELDQFEERLLQRWVERSAKALKCDRTRFLKELDAAFPGKVTDATTEDEYAGWFDLLAGRNDQWWRDDSPTPPLMELFDRAVQRLDLGPVPSLTRDEFAKYAKRVLKDQNPLPPSTEQDARSDEDADRAFRVLDRNGDGDLDELELTTDLSQNRLFVDADGDGRISKDEYRGSFRKRAEKKAELLVAKAGDAAKPTGDSKPKEPAPLPEWFTRLDANKDGQLSLYECRTGGGSVTLFADMDLNGDGYVTRDEYLRYAREREEKLYPKPRDKR